MTLKNEIFEGIAAYKALAPSAQDNYYNEMYEQAKKKRKKEEKWETDEQAQAEARRAPTSIVPKLASTATPGSGSAISGVPTVQGPVQGVFTDLPPTFRRGGSVANSKVRRYADGGSVAAGRAAARGDTDYDPSNPADGIILSILNEGGMSPMPQPTPTERLRSVTGTQRPNQMSTPADPQALQPTAPPPAPRRTADTSEAIATSGGSEAALTTTVPPPGSSSPPRGQAQAAQAPATPSAEPPVTPGDMTPIPTPTERLRATATSRGPMSTPVEPPTAPAPPTGTPSFEGSPVIGGESTTGVGRFLTRDAALAQTKIEQEIRALERQKLNVTPGALESTYPVERQEAAAKAAAIDKQIEAKRQELAALTGNTQQAAAAPGQTAPGQTTTTQPGQQAPPPPAGAAPAKPGATTPTAPNAGTALFGRPDVGETGGEATALKPTSPYPTKGVNTVPTKTAPKQNGPATGGGSTGPGGGQGAQPAPPAGGGAASRPYDQNTAPKGSLGDQSRTAAFDPTKDLYDSRNAGRVTQDYRSQEATGAPTPLQPADIQVTMQGIHQSLPGGPTVTGEGAASRGAYNQFVAAHNRGGKLEPGEAALVGMVGRYKGLLREGRIKEAAQMAVGIMQAASLEAGSRGRYAVDLFKSGQTQQGQQVTVDGLSHVPDGRSHKLNADGSITTIDSQTGQVTGQTQLTPQQWLALAMGLSDGSMLWQALQGTITAANPPDKDDANRRLRGTLLEEQIIGARQRNARGAGGGGGRVPPTGDPRVDALLAEHLPRQEPVQRSAGTPDQLSVDYTGDG